jgi:hypothetical protein
MARPFFTHPITDDSALGGQIIDGSVAFDASLAKQHLRYTPSIADPVVASVLFTQQLIVNLYLFPSLLGVYLRCCLAKEASKATLPSII